MTLDVNISSPLKYKPDAKVRFAYSGTMAFTEGTRTMQRSADVERERTFYRDEFSLRMFIKAAPHPVVITCGNGKVQFCNAFAEELFGRSEAELAGTAFSALVECSGGRASDAPIGETGFAALLPDAHPAVEGMARRKSGEVIPVELGSSQLELGGQSVAIHFLRDISFRKRSCQRIMELQRELMHLSRQTVLGELASAITHELNQPLTAITNYTAAARQCGCMASPENLEASFSLMEKAAGQAQRARHIMHKLRNLVRRHDVECAEGDLRLVLDEAVQLSTLGAAEYGIEVTVSMPAEPVMVFMDRLPVQILLTNLVRNAVDALSTWGGDKKVAVSLRVLPENAAEVSVQDSGAGIAAEVFDTIFDPFHSTKPDGLGMGLSICRRIAEAHDGRLAAKNRPEGGALFSFIVPMSNSK